MIITLGPKKGFAGRFYRYKGDKNAANMRGYAVISCQFFAK
jgi:hypothetical protein